MTLASYPRKSHVGHYILGYGGFDALGVAKPSFRGFQKNFESTPNQDSPIVVAMPLSPSPPHEISARSKHTDGTRLACVLNVVTPRPAKALTRASNSARPPARFATRTARWFSSW